MMKIFEMIMLCVAVLVAYAVLKIAKHLKNIEDCCSRLQNIETSCVQTKEKMLELVDFHCCGRGVFWSMNHKLTYLERRFEDQHLWGSECDRHVIRHLLQCDVWRAPVQTAFQWLQKELLESMQGLAKAQDMRQKPLTEGAWSLVLESAFREVKNMYWGHHGALRSLEMKIAWCRQMKWMQGKPDAGESLIEEIVQNTEGADESGVLPPAHSDVENL